LNDEDFENEFSHTIMHNQYLFNMRKKRAKPASISKPQIAPPPQPIKADDAEKPSFLVKQIAPSPKIKKWVQESPRAAKGGMVGHRPLSARKKDPSAVYPGYKPYNAKLAPSQRKSSQSSNKKGLVVQGESYKPLKSDHKKKRSNVYEEEKAKIARQEQEQK